MPVRTGILTVYWYWYFVFTVPVFVRGNEFSIRIACWYDMFLVAIQVYKAIHNFVESWIINVVITHFQSSISKKTTAYHVFVLLTKENGSANGVVRFVQIGHRYRSKLLFSAISSIPHTYKKHAKH